MPTHGFIEIVLKGVKRSISSILEDAKRETNADDVRFRVRDWRDESIVYVPEWVIGSGLDEVEPVLAQRFYYDKKRGTKQYPFDCFVGLKALIARLEEESKKKVKDLKLIQEIKELLRKTKESITCIEDFEEFRSQDLNDETIFQNFIKKLRDKFHFQDLDKQKIFKGFIEELKEKLKSWKSKKEEWGKLLAGQSTPRKLESKLEELKSYWKKEGADETIKLGEFSELYKKITENYEKYIEFSKSLQEEIVVEVSAFGRFLGVLNLHKHKRGFTKEADKHKKQGFTPEDEKIARNYAGKLAIACIERQIEQFREIQGLSRVISAESNFKKIATKISELIRKAVLKDSLRENKVFPLLYIPLEPINREEELDADQFMERWRGLYYAREKKNENDSLWEEENKLGDVPIRGDGLGRKLLDKWKDGSGRLFIDEIHVDDLFDSQGSRSALAKGVKTTGCLPLVYENEVYGLLYLHCKKRHFFTDMEVSVLEMVANQTAIAIKNAKIFGKSYEELFGSVLLEELRSLPRKHTGSWQDQKFSKYKEVWQILIKWADGVESIRGEEAIADATKDAIKNLCKNFNLPDEFSEYIEDYEKRAGALHSVATVREHFIHPFHVFLLGYIILANWKLENKRPLDLLGRNNDNLNLKAWFVTSIYHDVGYPGEKLELQVNDFFSKNVGCEIRTQFDWGPIKAAGSTEHIHELSRLFAKRMDNQKNSEINKLLYENWFDDRLLNHRDHGVLTALMLFKQWKASNQRKLPRDEEKLLQEASLAMGLHSWKRKVEIDKLKYDLGGLQPAKFPLAFFLNYCDYAQEWGRRVFREIAKEKDGDEDFDETLDTKLLSIKISHDLVEVTIWYHNLDEDADSKYVKKIEGISKQFEKLWKTSTGIKFRINCVDIKREIDRPFCTFRV